MTADLWIPLALGVAVCAACYVLFAMGWILRYYWRVWRSDRSIAQVQADVRRARQVRELEAVARLSSPERRPVVQFPRQGELTRTERMKRLFQQGR